MKTTIMTFAALALSLEANASWQLQKAKTVLKTVSGTNLRMDFTAGPQRIDLRDVTNLKTIQFDVDGNVAVINKLELITDRGEHLTVNPVRNIFDPRQPENDDSVPLEIPSSKVKGETITSVIVYGRSLRGPRDCVTRPNGREVCGIAPNVAATVELWGWRTVWVDDIWPMGQMRIPATGLVVTQDADKPNDVDCQVDRIRVNITGADVDVLDYIVEFENPGRPALVVPYFDRRLAGTASPVEAVIDLPNGYENACVRRVSFSARKARDVSSPHFEDAMLQISAVNTRE